MKKRKFNITLITDNSKEEYSLLGKYDQENNIISYQESNSLLTTVILDLNKKTLIRENRDYYLNYKLIKNQETDNEIRIKDLNKSMILRIKTEKFALTANKIEIIYTILDSGEKVNYQIEF